MLGKFLKKEADEVILPDMSRGKVEKTVKISIAKVKKPEDISKLREKVEHSNMLLIDIAKLYPGDERKDFVKKLKIMTQNHGAKIYGIDRNWILVTKYRIEQN